MRKLIFSAGGLGFLIGICSGGSSPVLTMAILIISAVMILAGVREEDLYE